MKRSIALAVASMVLVGALFAAGQSETETAQTDEGPVELTVWTWLDITPAIEAYEATHPNVSIELIRLGPWDLHDKFLVSLSSGQGLPDVVHLVTRRFPQYSTTGRLADFTPYLEGKLDSFDQGVLDAASYQGKVFGVPNDVSPGVLYYRSDIFEELGIAPIETFDDLREAGLILKDEGYQLMPMFYPSGGWGANALNLFLHSAQGNLFTADGAVRDPNPELEMVLEYLYELYFEDQTTSGIRFFSAEFWAALADGTYAAWPMNMAEGANIKSNMPDMAGQWSVTGFPQWNETSDRVTGVWGGTMATVPEGAPNRTAAIEFAVWMASTVEGQIAASESWNAVPSYKPALDDDYYAETDPYYGVNLYDAIYEIPPYYYYDWAQTETIVGNQLDDMFSGEQGFEETYSGIIADLKSELGR